MNKRETDFWRLLLGETYPEHTLRIGDTFYLRDGNVVIELARSENGVKVCTHAGFYQEREFAFARYFARVSDGLVPHLLCVWDDARTCRWLWCGQQAPKKHELEKLYTDLRAYIALWIRRK